MPEISSLLLFSLAATALLIIPGPAVVYIVTRSVAQGRAAGLLSMLGIHVGSLAHVVAAALGVSAVIAASPTALTIVKYLGVAYLVWLGVQALRKRSDAGEIGELPPVPGIRLFTQGIVVNVCNPKTAIFFLAFLPQFADPGIGPIGVQILIFGFCFIALGILCDGAYALLASSLARRLRRTPKARRRLDVASGVTLIGLGSALLVND